MTEHMTTRDEIEAADAEFLFVEGMEFGLVLDDGLFGIYRIRGIDAEFVASTEDEDLVPSLIGAHLARDSDDSDSPRRRPENDPAVVLTILIQMEVPNGSIFATDRAVEYMGLRNGRFSAADVPLGRVEDLKKFDEFERQCARKTSDIVDEVVSSTEGLAVGQLPFRTMIASDEDFERHAGSGVSGKVGKALQKLVSGDQIAVVQGRLACHLTGKHDDMLEASVRLISDLNGIATVTWSIRSPELRTETKWAHVEAFSADLNAEILKLFAVGEPQVEESSAPRM